MKHTLLILLLAASGAGALAQAPAKATSAAAKPAVKTATAAHPAGAAAATSIKLPPGIPPVKGLQKSLFTLKYQDIKIGTGADAEPNKMYQVAYTGWLAADGHKFDASADHIAPVMDKDGKPVLDADGKPKLGDVVPFTFPQGFGRVIPGWDQGFEGMKIGGKRRLFIPWQLAYGARGRPGPDPAHPVIPGKADLIFDVELVAITELPMPANHPGISGLPGGARPAGAPTAPAAPAPSAAPAAAAAPAQPAAGAPAAPQPK